MRQANLLPERRRLGSRLRGRIVALSLGFPMFVLVNLIGWLVGSSLLSADLGSAHAEIASIRSDIERNQLERASLRGELGSLRSERAAREAIAARPVWAALVRRIAVVSSMYGQLERLSVRPIGSERPRPSVTSGDLSAGFQFTLAGQATDATALTTMLLELEAIGVFDQVVLIASSRTREDGEDASVRFEIRCTIVGGGQ